MGVGIYCLAMKILFDEIHEGGLTLEVQDATWFPEGDWQRVGPVLVNLRLSRRNRQVFLDGRMQYAVRFECDCCLEPYEQKHDDHFQVEFEYLPSADPYWHSEAGEHECPEGEMDVVILSEPALHLEAILEQQVVLSLPVKRLCSDGCRGLCPHCGKNLNSTNCSCQDNEPKTPFSVLAQVTGR